MDNLCPTCKREWAEGSEQSLSIKLYGECIVCHFTPQTTGSYTGTKDEYDALVLEIKAIKELP